MDDNKLFRVFMYNALGMAALTGILLYVLLFIARV